MKKRLPPATRCGLRTPTPPSAFGKAPAPIPPGLRCHLRRSSGPAPLTLPGVLLPLLGGTPVTRDARGVGLGVAGDEVGQARTGELDKPCGFLGVGAGDPATCCANVGACAGAGVPRFKKEATIEAAADPACLGGDRAVSSARPFPAAASATSRAQPALTVRSRLTFPAAAPGRRLPTGTDVSVLSLEPPARWVVARSPAKSALWAIPQ